MTSSIQCLVIDANIAIRGMLPNQRSEFFTEHIRQWVEAGVRIAVPCLWLTEVTSVIHRLKIQRQIDQTEAELMLGVLLGLPFDFIAEDADLCRRAFIRAAQLGQSSAYDAFYLALADRLDAVFYTADKKLFHRCQDLYIDSVKLLE